MPVEVADLSGQLRVPVHVVAHRLFEADVLLVVGDAKVAEARESPSRACRPSVAGELGEVVMEHVVERVVGRSHLVDQIAALDEDAGVLRIGVG